MIENRKLSQPEKGGDSLCLVIVLRSLLPSNAAVRRMQKPEIILVALTHLSPDQATSYAAKVTAAHLMAETKVTDTHSTA